MAFSGSDIRLESKSNRIKICTPVPDKMFAMLLPAYDGISTIEAYFLIAELNKKLNTRIQMLSIASLEEILPHFNKQIFDESSEEAETLAMFRFTQWFPINTFVAYKNYVIGDMIAHIKANFGFDKIMIPSHHNKRGKMLLIDNLTENNFSFDGNAETWNIINLLDKTKCVKIDTTIFYNNLWPFGCYIGPLTYQVNNHDDLTVLNNTITTKCIFELTADTSPFFPIGLIVEVPQTDISAIEGLTYHEIARVCHEVRKTIT
ncbi:MAG: hypothetical protein AB1391_01995 [Candidatus Micrarchaeota archaeon]